MLDNYIIFSQVDEFDYEELEDEDEEEFLFTEID